MYELSGFRRSWCQKADGGSLEVSRVSSMSRAAWDSVISITLETLQTTKWIQSRFTDYFSYDSRDHPWPEPGGSHRLINFTLKKKKKKIFDLSSTFSYLENCHNKWIQYKISNDKVIPEGLTVFILDSGIKHNLKPHHMHHREPILCFISAHHKPSKD